MNMKRKRTGGGKKVKAAVTEEQEGGCSTRQDKTGTKSHSIGETGDNTASM